MGAISNLDNSMYYLSNTAYWSYYLGNRNIKETQMNSFQNAINNQKKYHVRIFFADGIEESHFDTRVSTHICGVYMEFTDNTHKQIEYDYIHRIEIHACAFPYRESTPFLYLFLK